MPSVTPILPGGGAGRATVFGAVLHGPIKGMAMKQTIDRGFAWWLQVQCLRLVLVCGAVLAAGGAHAAPYNEKLCPSAFPEHGVASDKSLLCYEQCKPDHRGLGPTCVQASTDSCSLTGDGSSCLSVPGCRAGEDNILGVCYRACPSGYNTAALSCTEKSPSGWSDAGAFFYRTTTTRVCAWGYCKIVPNYETRTKSIVARVNRGMANQCPAGQSYRLGMCITNKLSAYSRSSVPMSSVPNTATDSFVRTAAAPVVGDRFTVAVLSDTQLPWDETSPEVRAGKSTIESVWRNSRAYNLALVQSVNALQSSLQNTASPLAFTIINGDLTAYYHPEQASEFRAFYDPYFAWAYPNALKTKLYLGLGNHDYENNVGSCQAFSWDTNRCAKNAINLIRGSVFLGYIKNMVAQEIESYDAGSLAYSWNRGAYHFVQLHNGPLYQIPSLGISQSLQWLKDDLARARARGQSVIINLHRPEQADAPEFLAALAGQPVIAIFAGHLHASIGKFNDVVAQGRNIPMFLSGSADQQSFLLADFADTGLTVRAMSSLGGQAQARPNAVWSVMR